jgi:hypothetical protein
MSDPPAVAWQRGMINSPSMLATETCISMRIDGLGSLVVAVGAGSRSSLGVCAVQHLDEPAHDDGEDCWEGGIAFPLYSLSS